MKLSLLKCEPEQLNKKINNRIIICVITSVAVIILNLLLSVFVTSQTKIAFAVLNIVLDILLLWFLYTFISCALIPDKRMLRLMRSAEKHGQKINGNITGISEEVQSVQGYRCRQLKIETVDGERNIFVIVGTALENVQGKVSLTVTSNIVVEAVEL